MSVPVVRTAPDGSRQVVASGSYTAPVTRDEQILRALADGAVSTADLAQRTGLSVRAVQRGLHHLSRTGHVFSPERGAYRLAGHEVGPTVREAGPAPAPRAGVRPASPSAGTPPAHRRPRAVAPPRPLAPAPPDPTSTRVAATTPPPLVRRLIVSAAPAGPEAAIGLPEPPAALHPRAVEPRRGLQRHRRQAASVPEQSEAAVASGADQSPPSLASILVKGALLGAVAIIGLVAWAGRGGDGQAGSAPAPSPGGWPGY